MRREAIVGIALLLATVPLGLAAPAGSEPVPPPAPRAGAAGPGPGDPLVVVAHIDTGMNPYHADFRWDDPRAWQHPCTWLPKYPCNATRLDLTLGAATWQDAFEADRALWEGIQSGKLYWIPGTKVVGAISFGQDGAFRILDDHGHGTMTASRSVGNANSLCPECLLVSIEGLGTAGVTWAASSGFVDVQTNSWGSLLPGGPRLPLLSVLNAIAAAQRTAAQQHVVIFASGNGIEFQGFLHCPTHLQATGAPGVIQVGAHDNGHLTSWHCVPAHVITDGYGPWTALRDHLTLSRPDPVACCTSTSAPYAAGGAAAMILEARRVLGDPGPLPAPGLLARGAAGLVPQGPLADGALTLAELRDVLFHTATLRPVEGPHDGLRNWAADPAAEVLAQAAAPDVARLQALAGSPGQNPYCVGCFSTPVAWASIPAELGALWAEEGYGAVDPPSVALAGRVLRGEAAEPARPAEDALFAADQALRAAYFFGQLPPV